VLLPLPPYAPELNPTENIWEYMRQNWFGQRWPASSRQRFGSAKWILCRLGSSYAVAGTSRRRALFRPE
jgi:transposase